MNAYGRERDRHIERILVKLNCLLSSAGLRNQRGTPITVDNELRREIEELTRYMLPTIPRQVTR